MSYQISNLDLLITIEESLEDIWADFESNGEDQGMFGDFDRILILDDQFDPVIARPVLVPIPVPVPMRVECKFCKNNRKPISVFTGHSFKDKWGNCACPFLRNYKCPTCGATGDLAHTKKYCPKKKVYTEADTVKMEKRRKKV